VAPARAGGETRLRHRYTRVSRAGGCLLVPAVRSCSRVAARRGCSPWRSGKTPVAAHGRASGAPQPGRYGLRVTGSALLDGAWIRPFTSSRRRPSLRVLVTEQTFAGGKRADGRLLQPSLYVDAEELVLTMFVTPQPGFQSRSRNPETPVRIALPHPVGTRRLVDGALYDPPP
jgi:hypothetical protein